MNGWESFMVAQVSASAVLASLIFVGVSINLSKIIAMPRLPNRALEALIMLLAVLLISSLLLVPGQSFLVIGIEILTIGTITWVVTILLDISIWQSTDGPYRRQFATLIVMNQFALLPYIISGLVTLSKGESGLYWLVPGILFSFIKTVLDAWVLLVEINR